MVVESNTLYSIKARSSIRQPKEITIKKHYDYVVAIGNMIFSIDLLVTKQKAYYALIFLDFGTYSSSFSYARTKGEDDIMTVETWYVLSWKCLYSNRQ
jgi:hypothetical protein